MPLTINLRMANATDLPFIVKMGNAAIRGNRDPADPVPDMWTEDTARSYLTGDFRIGVALATWPERGIAANTPVAACQVFLGKKPVLWVNILALDSDVIADQPGNAAQRRRVVDRILVDALQFAWARGFTSARTRRIHPTSKMAAYIEGITNAVLESNPEGTKDFRGNIQQVLAELAARSPS